MFLVFNAPGMTLIGLEMNELTSCLDERSSLLCFRLLGKTIKRSRNEHRIVSDYILFVNLESFLLRSLFPFARFMVFLVTFLQPGCGCGIVIKHSHVRGNPVSADTRKFGRPVSADART